MIEILIVVAIMTILATLGVGYYSGQLEDARIAVRNSNMKLVNDSIANYYKNSNMIYPRYEVLDSELSPFMNRTASEIIREACNADGIQAYYRVVLPPKRTSPTQKPDDNITDKSSWKSASEIDGDANRGQYRVKEIIVSITHP